MTREDFLASTILLVPVVALHGDAAHNILQSTIVATIIAWGVIEL